MIDTTDPEAPDRRAPYWFRYSDGGPTWRSPSRRPPGEELAALRSGEGREPFTVPAMWPYLTQVAEPDRYASPRSDRFSPPPSVVAEHHALVIFGIHQQSQSLPVHRTGAGVGEAVKRLHRTGRFNEAAVDRRFHATVTADSLGEMAHHLRGLLRQLRSVSGITGLDYQMLFIDVLRWQDPRQRDRVRRRWGWGYHAFERSDEGQTDLDTAPAT